MREPVPLKPEEASVPPPTSPSLRRIEANRRNAARSTGPQTDAGKEKSRWNALKHGILAKAAVITEGRLQESPARIRGLLKAAQTLYLPVGFIEGMLVEEIVVAYVRLERVLRYEIGEVRALADASENPDHDFLRAVSAAKTLPPDVVEARSLLPETGAVEKILRYEGPIRKGLYRAINQLERLQRLRKGEDVPPPTSRV